MSEMREVADRDTAVGLEASDRVLIDAVQAGSVGAFGVLYEKYRPIALRGAERYLPSHHRVQAEDVVEVTFRAVYDAIRRGSRPRGSFRAYLLLSVRREAVRQQRRRERETVVEHSTLDFAASVPRAQRHDHAGVGSRPQSNTGQRAQSHDGSELDPDLLFSEVFQSLNARFRHALWLNEVEGRPTEEVASLLGITPNAAAALCYRARRALRAGYFAAYERSLASPTCQPLIPELASFVEAGRPTSGHDAVRSHLEGCSQCRDVVRGSARATTVLAGLAPFGLLSAGTWLDPQRPVSGGSVRRRGERAGAVAAVLLLVAGLVAAVVWPNQHPDPGAHAHAVQRRSASDDAAPAGPTSTATVPPHEVSPGVPTATSPLPDPTASPSAGSPGDQPPSPALIPRAAPAPATGTIVGRVTADPDGAGPTAPTPSQGTPVRVLDGSGVQRIRTTTDAHGRFRSVALPPGTYSVLATLPVGMTAGRGASGPDPTVRREVPIATAAVTAGHETAVATTFEPWRQLGLSGGGASAPTVGPGGTVAWTFEVSSAQAPTTDAVLDIVVARPVGSVLVFDWGGDAGRRPSDESDGGPANRPLAPVCDGVVEGERSVAVRCRLGRLDARPVPLTVQVTVKQMPVRAALAPSLTLTAGSGAAESGSATGAAVTAET